MIKEIIKVKEIIIDKGGSWLDENGRHVVANENGQWFLGKRMQGHPLRN